MLSYQVVRRETCPELEEAVNCFINQGWQPVGGVMVSQAVSHYQNREDTLCSITETTWAQAIYRVESTERQVI